MTDSEPAQADPDAEVGGPWTRHGHAVPGVTVEGPGRPKIARCGGPKICRECAADAAFLLSQARVIPPVAPTGGEREVVHDCSLNRCCNLCGRHLTPHVMQWADPCIDPSTSPG